MDEIIIYTLIKNWNKTVEVFLFGCFLAVKRGDGLDGYVNMINSKERLIELRTCVMKTQLVVSTKAFESFA